MVTARTGFNAATPMLRWLAVLFLALVLISALQPWLQRMGLGRLPGDFHFRFAGRDWHIPLTSTVLFSAVCSLIARWI